MATKIRLQRNGRKSYAFYSIVIADVRAPRDGKFTEKIGTFNPNTNPATVDLNFRARTLLGRDRCTANRHSSQHPQGRGRLLDEAPQGWR